VTPIDTATNTALAPIPAGTYPDAIAITPDGKTAYVANVDSDTVTPIATGTNTAGKAIKVGYYPCASRSRRNEARPRSGAADRAVQAFVAGISRPPAGLGRRSPAGCAPSPGPPASPGL
jgi:YVTN family beta-propeller protein